MDFPITVKGVTIPINVVVTDALTYAAIVGNDWLAKVKANIDYETSTMNIHWQGKDIEVPIEYWEMPMERRKKREEQEVEEVEEYDSEEDIDEKEAEESEEEEEYEEEELDEKVYCHFRFQRKKKQQPKRPEPPL